jgi:hypothetical protein
MGTLTINLQSVLGTEESDSIKNIKLYPNPVTDVLTIANIQNTDLKTIEIYNILGSMVMQVNIKDLYFNESFQLNIGDIKKGIYLIKLTAKNNQSKIQKLIIE